MATHSFTCKTSNTCLDFPATEHHCPLDGTHFTIPQRVEGWSRPGWLVTYRNVIPWSQTWTPSVTHSSTNWAQCGLTSLTKTNAMHYHHAKPPP